jgi:hypothetical protein
MKFDQHSALYRQPLFELISQSRTVHLKHWPATDFQIDMRDGSTAEE